MKKFLLGSVGLIALGMASAPASAADLAARPVYTKAAPMMAAVYDWSGFYVGINGGGGWTDDSWSNLAGTNLGSHTASGAVVGGQVGYRWQAGTWVFGLEAQGDWADITGSHTDLFNDRTDSSKLDALGLFTGQVGYAWNNTLLYVKGGAAVTDSSWNAQYFAPDFRAPATFVTGDTTRWGGTVGVGLEYGFAPNWSVGVEYDHLFMGRHDVDFTNVAGAVVNTGHVGGDTDLVTARLNYRFGGPVIGRY